MFLESQRRPGRRHTAGEVADVLQTRRIVISESVSLMLLVEMTYALAVFLQAVLV